MPDVVIVGRRARGLRRRVGARPPRRHRRRDRRARHRRLRRHRQVLRRGALPLRRLLARRDGQRRPRGVRERRRDPRRGRRLPPDRLRRRRRRAERRRAARLAGRPAGRRRAAPRRSTTPRCRSSGRWPTSTDFAAFAWESRGGYGDAYQTAQAFAAAARRAGVRLRQGTTVTGDRSSRADGPPACGSPTASTIAAGTVVRRRGPVVGAAARRARHRPADHRAPRADRARRPRRRPRARPGVLRPGVAAVRPARGRRASSCSATPTSPMLEPADPDRYSNRATEAFLDLTVEKVGTRFPGLDERVDRVDLRRLLRRHPGLQPGHLRDPGRRPRRRRRVLRARLQDLARRSGGWSPTSSSTGGAPTRTSRSRTSGSPASPRARSLRSPHPYVGAGEMR